MVTRGHSCTFRHDHQLSGIFYSLRYHIAGFIFNSAPRRIFKMTSMYPHCLMEDFSSLLFKTGNLHHQRRDAHNFGVYSPKPFSLSQSQAFSRQYLNAY